MFVKIPTEENALTHRNTGSNPLNFQMGVHQIEQGEILDLPLRRVPFPEEMEEVAARAASRRKTGEESSNLSLSEGSEPATQEEAPVAVEFTEATDADDLDEHETNPGIGGLDQGVPIC